jgi:class 3 adenylate cyclase
VLPFDRDDFARTSVEVGGEGWLPRFDAALAQATRIVHATEERYLGDDVLFEHAALLVEGLAALRAAQLQASPRLLCVIDEAATGHVGGTLSAFERWTQRVGPPDVIDLAALRGGATIGTARAGTDAAPRGVAHAAVSGATASATAAPSAPAATDSFDPAPEAAALAPASRPPRSLRTMLFADFAGYSRLHDANAAHFQADFWAILARQIESSAVKPLFANTWGDGLYLVFASPFDAASFALRVVEEFRAVDWTAVGLPETSQIRIALHTGPVFCSFDPIIGRDNYFGSSVTRAARIEPITPPGTVYASEAFAATLAASGRQDFGLEYVGQVALAKGYGESRVYRLTSR